VLFDMMQRNQHKSLMKIDLLSFSTGLRIVTVIPGTIGFLF
jgi:hypothetical protein